MNGDTASQTLTNHNSSIIFDRVVGSLGASISPDDYFGVEGEEGAYADRETEQEGVEPASGVVQESATGIQRHT